jgi:hypothetical protein
MCSCWLRSLPSADLLHQSPANSVLQQPQPMLRGVPAARARMLARLMQVPQGLHVCQCRGRRRGQLQSRSDIHRHAFAGLSAASRSHTMMASDAAIRNGKLRSQIAKVSAAPLVHWPLSLVTISPPRSSVRIDQWHAMTELSHRSTTGRSIGAN